MTIEGLADALGRHVDILREVRRQSAAIEDERKRQPHGIKQVEDVPSSQADFSAPLSWMILFLVCLEAF